MEEKEEAKELLNGKGMKHDTHQDIPDEKEVEITFDHGDLPKPPNDRYFFVFLIFLLHGIGVLLPWNLFITANSYFIDYKLNTTTSYDAGYRKNFLVYIGMGSQIPNLLLSACNVFFQSRGNSASQGMRFIVAVLLEIVVLAVTIILAIVDSSDWPGMFFALTIVSVIILNSCTGIYQSFVFGLAALLPMRYSNAIVIGNNLSGTIVAICSIITEAAAKMGSESSDNSSIRTAAIYYFVFAVVILLLCFDTYFLLPHLRFYRFYTKTSRKGDEATSLELIEKVGDDNDTDGSGDEPPPSSFEVLRNCFSVCCFCPMSRGIVNCHKYWAKYKEALRYCWVHCLSVFSVFFCTLSVFPELMSKVKPATDGFMGDWFTHVSCFLFFNLFATIGNLISNVVQKPGPKWLWIPVWARTIILIPFFMFCNVNPVERTIPVLFLNEWVYIAGVIVMAVSSGYLSSLCMMYAPSEAPAELKSIAGMLAAFCLVLGVCIGVQTSLFWSQIVVGLFSS